jgi:hypothetical protein
MKNIVSTLGTKSVDEVPVYAMPPLFDQTNKEQPSEKVSNLRILLGSCVKLLNDKKYLQVLESLLEKCNLGEEGENIVNHI